MKQNKSKKNSKGNKNKQIIKKISSVKQSAGNPDEDIMPYLKPYGILDPEGKYANPLTGYSYSSQYFKYSMGEGLEEGFKPWPQMPVYKDRKIFFNKLHKANVMLVISTTGSGKTVLAPKLLLHYFDYNCQIAITIPKQKIVESAGRFAAKTLDVKLGEHVGYVHGSDKNNYNRKHSNLIYMTEGILLAQMTGSDPDLSQYSGVIIDEAHERSTNVDILLMLLKQLVKRRPEFKLIIMSATVNEQVFKDYFSVPGIEFTRYEPTEQETLFDIDHQFAPSHIPKQQVPTELAKKMKEVLKRKGKHVIAFVSTKAEADGLCRELREDLEKSEQKPVCIKYYSSISKYDKKYVDAADEGKLHDMGHGRLIVAATNAVESSITISGTEYVLDTGMEFRVSFDPIRLANVRGKTYSTQAQIKQRCGRTGRTNAGYCVRIYSKAQYNHFDEFPEPTIKTENFTSNMLDIIGMKLTGNLTNGLALIQEMISPPDKPYLKHAINNLYYLGLMYKDGNLTPVGKIVRKFNKIQPELGLMVLASTAFKCTYEVAIIAAMMSIGGLDQWVSEPDEHNKFRTKQSYIIDIRRWSREFYDYGDPFVMLSIYMEYYNAKNKSKWCTEHGVHAGNISNLETKYDKRGRPTKFGLIDDVLRVLEGLAYYPQMFDEPDREPLTTIKSKYRSLTQINDNRYSKKDEYSPRSNKHSGGGTKRRHRSIKKNRTSHQKRSKYIGKRHIMQGGAGGRAKKRKAPKVDKQKIERDNKEDFSKKVFKEYYVPADGNLPRKPDVSYLEDEILCCIYYAFHRNIGVYLGGGGKKYRSKVSPVDGSMKNSIYDIIPELEAPEICIYHTLDVSENEYGKEMSGYQTICSIDEDLMAEFL
jgi:hypothetical protein